MLIMKSLDFATWYFLGQDDVKNLNAFNLKKKSKSDHFNITKSDDINKKS